MSDVPFDRRAIPAGATVGEWCAPDGWRHRTFDWPVAGEPCGTILFQPGRADIFEKTLETFDHWHRAGWHVRSFDWRGQGGSGRLSPHPHVGHVERLDLLVDDLAAFWAEFVASAPGPRVAMGHSMGGHLTLRALVERRIMPDAAVLVAPMLGIRSPIGARLGTTLAGLMARIGNPARAAWNDRNKFHGGDGRQRFLTSDRARFEDKLWWHQQYPHLMTGPPSWGWISEAFRSTAALAASPDLARMEVPVLMLVADADRLVDPRIATRVAARLPDVRLVRFGAESAHEILREVDPVRNRALAEIDRFLAERVGAPA
jgi:lysophospholipase